MKPFWKVLGVTALAASLIPYHVDSDETAGTKTVQALLWQLRTKPSEVYEDEMSKELTIGLCLPDFKKLAARCKRCCAEEAPGEAVSEAPVEAPAAEAPTDAE